MSLRELKKVVLEPSLNDEESGGSDGETEELSDGAYESPEAEDGNSDEEWFVDAVGYATYLDTRKTREHGKLGWHYAILYSGYLKACSDHIETLDLMGSNKMVRQFWKANAKSIPKGKKEPKGRVGDHYEAPDGLLTNWFSLTDSKFGKRRLQDYRRRRDYELAHPGERVPKSVSEYYVRERRIERKAARKKAEAALLQKEGRGRAVVKKERSSAETPKSPSAPKVAIPFSAADIEAGPSRLRAASPADSLALLDSDNEDEVPSPTRADPDEGGAKSQAASKRKRVITSPTAEGSLSRDGLRETEHPKKKKTSKPPESHSREKTGNADTGLPTPATGTGFGEPAPGIFDDKAAESPRDDASDLDSLFGTQPSGESSGQASGKAANPAPISAGAAGAPARPSVIMSTDKNQVLSLPTPGPSPVASKKAGSTDAAKTAATGPISSADKRPSTSVPSTKSSQATQTKPTSTAPSGASSSARPASASTSGTTTSAPPARRLSAGQGSSTAPGPSGSTTVRPKYTQPNRMKTMDETVDPGYMSKVKEPTSFMAKWRKAYPTNTSTAPSTAAQPAVTPVSATPPPQVRPAAAYVPRPATASVQNPPSGPSEYQPQAQAGNPQGGSFPAPYNGYPGPRGPLGFAQPPAPSGPSPAFLPARPPPAAPRSMMLGVGPPNQSQPPSGTSPNWQGGMTPPTSSYPGQSPVWQQNAPPVVAHQYNASADPRRVRPPAAALPSPLWTGGVSPIQSGGSTPRVPSDKHDAPASTSEQLERLTTCKVFAGLKHDAQDVECLITLGRPADKPSAPHASLDAFLKRPRPLSLFTEILDLFCLEGHMKQGASIVDWAVVSCPDEKTRHAYNTIKTILAAYTDAATSKIGFHYAMVILSAHKVDLELGALVEEPTAGHKQGLVMILLAVPLASHLGPIMPNPVKPDILQRDVKPKIDQSAAEPGDIMETYGLTKSVVASFSHKFAQYRIPHPETDLDHLIRNVHRVFKDNGVLNPRDGRQDVFIVACDRIYSAVRSASLASALPRKTRIMTVGPTLSLLRHQWTLRPVWTTGGLVTFSPTFILRSPDKFAEIMKLIRPAEHWAAYIIPEVLEWASTSWNEPTRCPDSTRSFECLTRCLFLDQHLLRFSGSAASSGGGLAVSICPPSPHQADFCLAFVDWLRRASDQHDFNALCEVTRGVRPGDYTTLSSKKPGMEPKPVKELELIDIEESQIHDLMAMRMRHDVLPYRRYIYVGEMSLDRSTRDRAVGRALEFVAADDFVAVFSGAV